MGYKTKDKHGSERPKYLQVRMTEEEKELFREASWQDGHMWLTGWFRQLAINRAKKVLDKMKGKK